MQAEVFFFHPGTHKQSEWIYELGQFIEGLILFIDLLCNTLKWYSHLYFLKPLGECIARKHIWHNSMVYCTTRKHQLHNYFYALP